MKKLLCILLVCVLALSAVSAFAEEEKEVVTITYYGQQNNRNSMDGFMNDYLEEKIGVRVEIIPWDSDKTQALLASRELPDIGKYYLNGSVANVIDTGLLLDLTPYLDQIPNYSEVWTDSVKYMTEVVCEGKGLYALPLELGTYNSFPIDPGCYDVALRWDVYEAIGAPEINGLDDLIDVLAQMMEYMPYTEDGTKTWGIIAFSNWDGSGGMWPAYKIPYIEGTMFNVGSSLMEYDTRTKELTAMISEDSSYMRGVKFIYDCQQAGILDPDSSTQTYEATQAKLKSGAAMCVMAGNYVDIYNSTEHGNAENPSGYLPLCADWIYPIVSSENKLGSATGVVCVSASTDKLDACLKFLNELYDEETMLTMYNGPRGEMWDIVDGKLVSLDGFWEMYNTGSYTLASGEVLQTGQFWCQWGLTNDNMTSYGEPIRQTEWSTTALAATDTKIYDMWRETTGYDLPINGYREMGNLCYNTRITAFLPTLDEEMTLVRTSVGEKVVAYSWKMAYAADETEFWSLYEQMRAECVALGIETLEENLVANWEIAAETAALYGIE